MRFWSKYKVQNVITFITCFLFPFSRRPAPTCNIRLRIKYLIVSLNLIKPTPSFFVHSSAIKVILITSLHTPDQSKANKMAKTVVIVVGTRGIKCSFHSLTTLLFGFLIVSVYLARESRWVLKYQKMPANALSNCDLFFWEVGI